MSEDVHIFLKFIYIYIYIYIYTHTHTHTHTEPVVKLSQWNRVTHRLSFTTQISMRDI
jgi:hypothetical protein